MVTDMHGELEKEGILLCRLRLKERCLACTLISGRMSCVSSPWHFTSCYIDGNNSLIHDLLIWRLKESRKMAVDRYFIRQSHTVLASSTSLSVLTVVSLHPSSISHMPVSSATDSWSCQGTKLHRVVRRNTVHLMSF